MAKRLIQTVHDNQTLETRRVITARLFVCLKRGDFIAQFTALSFDFANNNSINYGVCINGFDNSHDWKTEDAGSNISIIADFVPRRAEQFVYGVRQDESQQFDIIISSPNPKSRAEIDRMLAWLIQPTPQYLCVNQPDMQFYRYRGFFRNPKTISVNDMPFGLQLTFVSTSPYAYTFPKTTRWDITAPTAIIFNNESGDSDYLFPTLYITPSNVTQTFSIVNHSDNGHEFKFTFDSPYPNGNEVITVDNRLQIIQSSMGNDFSRRRFNQFNMNYFRLVRGGNELRITGNGSVEMYYVFARRIGN